jgi:hypothetical protein
MAETQNRPSLFDSMLKERNESSSAPFQQAPNRPLAESMVGERKSSFQSNYPQARTITPSPEQDRPELTMGQVGSEALRNAPGSVANALYAATAPIHSPIETAQSLYSLGKGGISKLGAIPGQTPQEKEEAEKVLDDLLQSYGTRYGSWKDIKQTMAEDPAGVLMDLSLPFTAGGGMLSRVGGVTGKVGKIASKTGQVLDPLSSGPAIIGAIPGVKKGLGAATQYALLGPLENRAGVVPTSMAEAFRAGKTADPKYDTFLDQMRGKAKPSDIIAETEDTLRLIADKNKAKYLSDMQQPLTQKIVDLTPIRAMVTQKLADTSHLASGIQMQRVQQALDNFENRGVIAGYQGSRGYQVRDPMNPTISDVDKLKQHIRELIDDPTAPGGAAASEVASNIGKEIRKVDSGYADIMERYGDTIDQLRRFRVLAGQSGKIPEERIAKMMKGAKDKYKGSIFEELAAVNPDLALAIKGQSLSPVLQFPSPTEMAATGAGTLYMTQHPILAGGAVLADIASKNPRALGESALKLGQASRLAEKAGSSGVVPFGAQIGYLQMRQDLEKEKQKELAQNPPLEITVPVPLRANGGRVARASGGRIEILRGVRALMQAAENAKKSISKSTETLLDKPDEQIAQALHVAKKNI